MSTTPAPTDLDAPPLDAGYDVLDALVQSVTPGPWDDEYSETHEVWIVYDADQEKVAECFDSATAALIAAARSALPALLDELAEHRASEGIQAGVISQLNRELRAAREELAKTRAELASRTLWHYYATCGYCGAQTGEPCHHMDDDRGVLDRPHLSRDIVRAEANPATTAEPADEPKATVPCDDATHTHCTDVHCACGCHDDQRFDPFARRWVDAEPADEPKATCGHAYIGNEGEFTCDLYAPHNGKQHWASLAEFAWTDERAA